MSELPKIVPDIIEYQRHTLTIFRVFDSRGSIEIERLLGKDYAGVMGSDRYSAYDWIDPLRRPVWWAHLKRDCQALVVARWFVRFLAAFCLAI